MNADADLQCKVCAQFLAERAAKVTDDPDQMTLMAYQSEEALVLVLRVRAALKKDRSP